MAPANSEAQYWLAVIADEQGRFADAERHYSALLKQSPRDPNVLASLGWSYLLQGRYDESERVLRNALLYAPAHQTALYNLGWLYGTRGDYEQALSIFRSAGSEADAQRAIAELKQSSPSELVAGTEVYAANDRSRPPAAELIPANVDPRTGRSDAGYPNNAAPQFAGDIQRPEIAIPNPRGATRERATSREITAPAPWNGGRGAGSEAPPRAPSEFATARAGSSPTQANQARQAEPQTSGLGRDASAGGFAQIQPTGMEPMNYEQSTRGPNGLQPPVITPRVVGSGTNGGRPGSTALNSPASGSPLPAGAGSRNSPLSNGTAAGDTRLPEWSSAPAADRPGAAQQGTGDPQRGRISWSDAQASAAQLGLSAGVAGPIFFVPSSAEPPPGEGTAGSRPVLSEPAVSAATPQVPAGPSGPGRQAIASRLPPPPSYALTPETAAPQTSSLPPWPGRPSLAAPIPTEVMPSAEPPGLGAADSVPPVSYSTERSLPVRGR